MLLAVDVVANIENGKFICIWLSHLLRDLDNFIDSSRCRRWLTADFMLNDKIYLCDYTCSSWVCRNSTWGEMSIFEMCQFHLYYPGNRYDNNAIRSISLCLIWHLKLVLERALIVHDSSLGNIASLVCITFITASGSWERVSQQKNLISVSSMDTCLGLLTSSGRWDVSWLKPNSY